jgi:hypothetical protein
MVIYIVETIIMASHRRIFYCQGCDTERAFRKSYMDHSFHRALLLATLGLWTLGWLACTLRYMLKPWKCPSCGRSALALWLHLRAISDRAIVRRELRRLVQD